MLLWPYPPPPHQGRRGMVVKPKSVTEIMKGRYTMATVTDYFGSLVFDDRVMSARLPADVYQSLRKTIDEGAQLNLDVALKVRDLLEEAGADPDAAASSPPADNEAGTHHRSEGQHGHGRHGNS